MEFDFESRDLALAESRPAATSGWSSRDRATARLGDSVGGSTRAGASGG